MCGLWTARRLYELAQYRLSLNWARPKKLYSKNKLKFNYTSNSYTGKYSISVFWKLYILYKYFLLLISVCIYMRKCKRLDIFKCIYITYCPKKVYLDNFDVYAQEKNKHMFLSCAMCGKTFVSYILYYVIILKYIYTDN